MDKISFSAIADHKSKLLILGSLPGDRSLAEMEYYAHPQNRFWKIMAILFEQDFKQSYKSKKEFLIDYNIALWDVCAQAYRQGSLDSDIKNEIPNDIPTLLEKHPNIKHIVFNGQKAANLFKKHFKNSINIPTITLPSTSPANAKWQVPQLLLDWQIVKEL